MNPVYEKLGARIKKLREKANISQNSLAAAVGLSRVSITNIEAGRQSVAYHQVLKIYKILRNWKPTTANTFTLSYACGHEIELEMEFWGRCYPLCKICLAEMNKPT